MNTGTSEHNGSSPLNRKRQVHGPRPGELSRREFIGTSVAAGAALGASAAAAHAADRANQRKRPLRTGGPQSGGADFDQDLVLLINRATGGFSLNAYNQAESMGYEGYLNYLLNESPTNVLAGQFDPPLDGMLSNFDITPWTAQQIRDVYKFQGSTSSIVALRQTMGLQIMLACYGRAQLHYRVFQFWNHHFNIDIDSSTHQRWLLWPYLRDKILANSMATVPELVLASAQGGAMMHYLDNNLSTLFLPNENYAREIMELHTLGVDNGYTQFDIEQLARILTGWGVCLGEFGCAGATQEYGDFRFTSGDHDFGTKDFLGTMFPFNGNAGFQEGVDAINILTSHENTAEYISRKMARFFLGGLGAYNPAESIVQATKDIYLDSGGDIPAMLGFLLSHEVLTTYAEPKYRRPFDYATAVIRATDAQMIPTATQYLDGGTGVAFVLRAMGMQVNGWGPPNGPDDTPAWAAANALPRWEFADRAAEQGLADTTNFAIGGVGGLLEQVSGHTPGAHAQGLSDVLTGGRMTDKEVDDLSDFLGNSPGEGLLQEGLALAMQMPTFQFI